METFCSFPSWLLLSSLFFTCIYTLGYWVIFAHRWPRGSVERFKAASCCMSIVHGTSTSFAAMVYILCIDKTHTQQHASWLDSCLDAPNTPFQDALLEYSSAYFLIDLLHYALFVPCQPLFVLHHIFSTAYMLSCRFYTQHGAFSIIILFAVLECTSFLQNLWSFSTLTENKSLFDALNVPFLTVFTVVRGLVTPWVTWKLCAHYLFHADPAEAAAVRIPFWIAAYWMGSVWMGMTGSLYWVAKLWAKLLLSWKASESKSTVMDLPTKSRIY